MGLVGDGVEGAIIGTALYEGRFTLDRGAGADPPLTLGDPRDPVPRRRQRPGGKGVNFRELRDAGDPVELAALYDAQGADELTFLDISASHEGRATTLEVVSRTAEQVFIPLAVGGGISSTDDVDTLLRAGADKVGSTPLPSTGPSGRRDRRPVRQPGARALGRRPPGTWNDSGFEVTTHGGRKSAGLDAIAWAKRACELGAGEILLNAMDADGTRGRLRPRADPGGTTSRSASRSSRAGARGRPSTSRRRSTPVRTRCSRRASSTSARCGSRTSSGAGRRRSPVR